ncbi:hypothetical protein BLA24064_02693 [Burkholderia latens]|uniref:Uncharacterized protein n=1 Tax=Burkholderia latens TaxID=488446 RepID=A0A6P2KRI1_9BURK|nr:hypothetical protein BLA24064_02693 [Burkholderia latens]
MARTPANARAAPARALRSQAPEKSHRRLLKALTSRSWKSSPRAPGRTHRSVPNVLTDVSRRRSPSPPGKAHQRVPQRLTGSSREGSPVAPVSPHLAAPGKAHFPLPKNLTFASCPMPGRGMRRAAWPNIGRVPADAGSGPYMPYAPRGCHVAGVRPFLAGHCGSRRCVIVPCDFVCSPKRREAASSRGCVVARLRRREAASSRGCVGRNVSNNRDIAARSNVRANAATVAASS